jgi:uncharacterized protein involved in exopolysaccharide biosynthesis
MLLGAVVGVGVTLFRPTLYEAVTTLLVTPPPNAPALQISPATFRAILVNGTIAQEIVNELGLSQPPHNLSPQLFLDRALTVEQVAATNVVRVRVALRSPDLAAEATRRLAQKAIALTRNLNQLEGASAHEQLKSHLAESSARMAEAEKELLAFQQRAQVDLVTKDTQAMLEERGDLLKLTISIESEKARLQAAEQEIQRQEKVLPVRRAVGAEEALRRTDDTEDVLDASNPFINPVYQSLDFQIASSRARLAGLEQERRQLVDVRKLGGEELSRLNDLYASQIELARRQANFDLAKRIYSDLAVRAEEARTQSLGNSPQLQLVDNAISPDRPMSAGRLRAMLLGLVAGALAAGLVALALEGHQIRKTGNQARLA